MYDLAHPVNVVKAYEALTCQLTDQGQWHAFVVVSLNDFEEVDTQNLEDHNEMLSVRTMVDK